MRTLPGHLDACVRDPMKATGYWCARDCPVARRWLARIERDKAQLVSAGILCTCRGGATHPLAEDCVID